MGKVVFRVCSVGKRWERAALEDLEQLERLVNPHYIESGKIGGGTAPLAPQFRRPWFVISDLLEHKTFMSRSHTKNILKRSICMYCITARKLYFISQTLVHCSCRKDFFVRHLYNYLLVITPQNCSAWTKLVLALLTLESRI